MEKVTSRLAPSFLPSTAVLEMTYRCNHKCLFCSCPWENKNGKFEIRKELTTEEWKQLIAKLCSMGVTSFAFTGGEPLLRKDIFEIIKFAAAQTCEHIETKNEELVTEFKPPQLYLISNGTLVNEEVLDFCKEYNAHLSMSLPGLTTYKEHTGGVGSVENILHWFGEAKKRGMSTTVNSTTTAKNIFELYNTIAEALIAGADTLLLNRFLPGGRGMQNAQELMLTEAQINEMIQIADEVLTASERFGHVGTELPACIIKYKSSEHLVVGTGCSAATQFFVVGPGGWIRTCNHSPIEMLHFSEIENLKDHPYWKQFVFKEYHPEMCKNCDVLFHCDGGCREAAHVYRGCVDGNDPVFI